MQLLQIIKALLPRKTQATQQAIQRNWGIYIIPLKAINQTYQLYKQVLHQFLNQFPKPILKLFCLRLNTLYMRQWPRNTHISLEWGSRPTMLIWGQTQMQESAVCFLFKELKYLEMEPRRTIQMSLTKRFQTTHMSHTEDTQDLEASLRSLEGINHSQRSITSFSKIASLYL